MLRFFFLKNGNCCRKKQLRRRRRKPLVLFMCLDIVGSYARVWMRGHAETLPRSHAGTQTHSRAAPPWLCGSVPTWLCGSVPVWLCACEQRRDAATQPRSDTAHARLCTSAQPQNVIRFYSNSRQYSFEQLVVESRSQWIWPNNEMLGECPCTPASVRSCVPHAGLGTATSTLGADPLPPAGRHG